MNAATEQTPPYRCQCGQPAIALCRWHDGRPYMFVCDDHWLQWPLDRQEDLVPGVTPAGLEDER